MFNSIDTLLNRKPAPRYPSCVSDEVLANRFISFFLEKINIIRSSIVGDSDADIPCPLSDVVICTCDFLCFQPVTQDQVSKLIISSTIKSCDLDPIPAAMLKKCWPAILPVITEVVNRSLDCAIMPEMLKIA